MYPERATVIRQHVSVQQYMYLLYLDTRCSSGYVSGQHASWCKRGFRPIVLTLTVSVCKLSIWHSLQRTKLFLFYILPHVAVYYVT